MNSHGIGNTNTEEKLSINIITTNYIKRLKLDESKKYKVMIINKNANNVIPESIEPAKVVLIGRLVSQYNFMFVFECITNQKLLKKVCVNKIDYILNNKLIKILN
jgi:fructose-1,6-bisphosphatase/sedoheptulose 1,7-bisphosphatase-like protein